MPSNNAVLLSETFERLTTILAQALVKAQRSSSLPPLSPALAAHANVSTATKETWDSATLNQKMADMEHHIETWIIVH